MKIDDNRQTTADRCKSKKKMIMKARNLESAKKGLGFYTTPSSFVSSPPAKITAGKPSTGTAGKFRVFVVNGSAFDFRT